MSGQEPLFGEKSHTATERDVLDALRRRYTKIAGNGQRYVIAEHVRNETAWASRTADAIVRDTWNSSGRALHGFEVKVSRSDWLTELKDPEKAQEFAVHCDYWWLAVSDNSIVRDDLPAGWGLLVMAKNGTLRVKVQATKIDPEPMGSQMRTAFDRAISKTAKRHLILDLEAGKRQICERFNSPGSCHSHRRSHPGASLCWSCRATALIETQATS